MIAVDLFCGAGGLTRGLLNAGIQVVLGVDVNEDCRRTYEHNNKPATFLPEDLRKVTAADIRRYFPPKCTDEVLLAGCAPCQPFSAHRRNKDRSNERTLLREFARLACELKPDWILIENVPGLAKVPGFSTFRRFQQTLAELHYEIAQGVIDAKALGVPQSRRRFVMIGMKHGTPTLPAPTHGTGLLPYATVRDAIKRFPAIAAGKEHADIPNHRAAAITEINLTRLRNTPKNGGGRLDWSDDLQLECHRDYEGHSDVYGRMKWNAPAPTLTCRCFSISNGRYGHPTQQRAISLREAAAIQTFPDDYEFFGASQRALGAQIGNAVPVLLAEVMGRHILDMAARRAAAPVRRTDDPPEADIIDLHTSDHHAMRNKFLNLRYYNTYYYAQMISSILADPFPYIRTVHDLFENDGETIFFTPYPKVTALHIFSEFCIEAEFSEKLSDEDTNEILGSKRKLLPVNLALNAHGIEHTTLAEWLADRGRAVKDADADDLYDYFNDLRLEEAYERLFDQMTDEVFFIMFLNRRALEDLNRLIAGYISEICREGLADDHRCFFAGDGVLKRRSIPRWAQRAVYYRDRGACAYCHRDLSGIVAIDSPDHFDHIIPLVSGGINDVTNLQLLCGPCNLRKGRQEVSVSEQYERWYSSDE